MWADFSTASDHGQMYGWGALDARTSDAVAIALRAAVPILVDDAIFDAVGVAIDVEEDDEVERFREFLDQVSAEDFEDDDRPPGSDT